MASDDRHRYTKENPHPADEDLSPKLKELIYVGPDELPELPDPSENGRDPFIHGGRIGEEDDE